MANEISIRITASQTSGGSTISIDNSDTISLGSGQVGKFSNTQNVGTSTEAILVPADDDISYIVIKNLDPTNFVLIDFATPAALMKLKPGEAMAIRPADSSAPVMYALADTAAVDIEVLCFGSDVAA